MLEPRHDTGIPFVVRLLHMRMLLELPSRKAFASARRVSQPFWSDLLDALYELISMPRQITNFEAGALCSLASGNFVRLNLLSEG